MRFFSSRLLKRVIQAMGLGAGLLLLSLSSFAQGNAGRILARYRPERRRNRWRYGNGHGRAKRRLP